MGALGILQKVLCVAGASRSGFTRQYSFGCVSPFVSADAHLRSLRRDYSAASSQRDILVVDFDDTCTAGDTISHLVSATMMRLGGDSNNEEKLRLYEELVREYVIRRKTLMNDLLLPNMRERKGEAWLQAFLHSTSVFDIDSNNIAIESRLLAGATMESLRNAARNVQFRPHCIETLTDAMERGMDLTIVSVNWSSEFIWAAFEQSPLRSYKDRPIRIVANSLDFEGDKTTGLLRSRPCQTALDKQQIMKEIHSMCRYSMYVGDSVTDIGSLLQASTGIIMGNDPVLREVLQHAGISVVPLQQHTGAPQQDPMTLYHTDSWHDISKIYKRFA